MARNKVKWNLIDKDDYKDGEVAIYEAEFFDPLETANAFAEASAFWFGAYDPLDIDDLSVEELELYEKEGRWILGRNCRAPFAECDPLIVFHAPTEILDPDPMQYSFGRMYKVTVMFFDSVRAVHFKLFFD
jgi:hypothetical protein